MYFLVLTVGNVIITAALVGVLAAYFFFRRRELRR